MHIIRFFLIVSAALSVMSCADDSITSPDGKIEVSVSLIEGVPSYSITSDGQLILEPSKLGIEESGASFSKGLRLISTSGVNNIKEDYEMIQGKRRINQYTAREKSYLFVNEDDRKFEVIFRVSNDGVAFRYSFPDSSNTVHVILEEATSFNFTDSTKAFLQPMSAPKTGWARVNPCYEEFYEKRIPVGTKSSTGYGWVFPSLFNTGDKWVLISEAALDSTFCAARLRHDSKDGEYQIGYADSLEAVPGREFLPHSKLPWKSPWRVITIGNLSTIVESNLGLAVAEAAKPIDFSFVKPGHSSWSWAILKDDSTVFDVQKKFVNYAAEMQWDYCLVDADWDRKIGYEKIRELADYASTRNVGLLVWYNSSGDWNDTPYSPKSKLLNAADRRREFALLQGMGIKGVKVDFFAGDAQSMMKYYIDILNDAAAHKLMVNFHGATLPRGWHRTYPNLMSAEAIKGFEYVTFEQLNADQQPSHAAMLPFTRNAFDPMDFTPLSLDTVPGINRRTTKGFELALPIIFLSGIQHFVETPSGMAKMNEDVKNYLRNLPVQWDDSKFIYGYPGKDVVIARRSGERWYIGGINGENIPKTLTLNLGFLANKHATLITDDDNRLLSVSDKEISDTTQIKFRAHGGFAMIVE